MVLSEDEAFDHHKFFKNHPEELVHRTKYDKDFEELYKTLGELKDKGVITDEKSASQKMHHKHD